jgi:hypothetical protein
MEGQAALWLQEFRQMHLNTTWEQFIHAVFEEFGPDEFETQMHKLLLPPIENNCRAILY